MSKEFLKELIHEAGTISMDYREKLASVKVDNKSQKDLVTEADVAVENFIVERIQQNFPDHSILGEESGSHQGNEYCWIIDPIDGTTSFVHEHPFYSVSIALKKQEQLILGGVYAPVLNELFLAERGQGAFLNDKRITVSKRDQLICSVLATGFACVRSNLKENNLPYFKKIVPQIRDVRRFGSAAIDLCYVACGRLEGFWELNLKIYDVAAGFLILEEAGGMYTDFTGTQENLCNQVVATNGLIHDQLIEQLS